MKAALSGGVIGLLLLCGLAALAAISGRQESLAFLSTFGLPACLVAALVSALLAHPSATKLAELAGALRLFQSGNYGQQVPHATVAGEIGDVARAMAGIQQETARQSLIVMAMNGSDAMIMVTDPEERIVSMTEPLRELFVRHQPTYRANQLGFSVDNMVGQHIDYYRQNPALKRELLLDDGNVRKVRYDVAGDTLMIDMTYVHSADGTRIGHTLLWRNVTDELLGQAEVAALVQAAQAGNFSSRLKLENKRGFVRDIASGLNNLSAAVEDAMHDFSGVMAELSQGNLTRHVDAAYEGVLAEMSENINKTIDRLADTVVSIQRTTREVSSAAKEINSGATDLARRTEDQASSLEETAATTEQLAASVKASAQSSRSAASAAQEAMTVAEDGGQIVTNAVEAMNRIEAASRKIADITTVIDGIAFQTNLLALNAAVEAARAGDAGKGFAVVASEVRTLAQRSGEASKDINGLIASATEEVAQGVTLVRSAGTALEQIVDASKRVATTIAEISAASGEQAHGIDEMSQAVAHLDEMTQQNAGLAEESAASATSLSQQIGQLDQLVATFRTNATPAAANEPDRLRRLAAAAFAELRTARPAKAPIRPQVQRSAGGSHQDAWEEF